MIGVVTLLVANALVVRGVRRHDRLDRLVEGDTVTLIRKGQVDQDAIRHLGIREADLKATVLRQGAEDTMDVEEASMYPSGAILVDLTEEARDASKMDLERVERKIDDLRVAVERLAPSA